MAQYPYFAPSVFNFFLPTYLPNGPAGDAGLVAPEMEIIHSYTAIATINMFNRAIVESVYITDEEEEVWLDLESEIELAEIDPLALVDRLDLLLTYGTLSDASRQVILDAILPLGDPEQQALLALYLVTICPEYAVQR